MKTNLSKINLSLIALFTILIISLSFSTPIQNHHSLYCQNLCPSSGLLFSAADEAPVDSISGNNRQKENETNDIEEEKPEKSDENDLLKPYDRKMKIREFINERFKINRFV